ncbi:permease [Ectothiorhodospiraceae bacterium 2226]|nr:permease [Ectothiorhodospiraceae bacterium 2226]
MAARGGASPWINGIFLLIILVGGGWLLYREGWTALSAASLNTFGLLALLVPILAAALLVSGYVQQLLPRERLQQWLGGRGGWRGLAVATVAGALTPGGPFAAFPLVAALYRAGVGAPVCVAYLTAWSTLGLHRIIIWEVPLLGEGFVLLRYLASLPLPFLAGWITAALLRRSPSWL